MHIKFFKIYKCLKLIFEKYLYILSISGPITVLPDYRNVTTLSVLYKWNHTVFEVCVFLLMWLGYLSEIPLKTAKSLKFTHIIVCVRIYFFILGIFSKAIFNKDRHQDEEKESCSKQSEAPKSVGVGSRNTSCMEETEPTRAGTPQGRLAEFP